MRLPLQLNANELIKLLPHNDSMRLLEFKAVIVLPTITHNYGNYLYSNYVSNAPVGKVIFLNT